MPRGDIQSLNSWLLRLTPTQRWLLVVVIVEAVLVVGWILRWLV